MIQVRQELLTLPLFYFSLIPIQKLRDAQHNLSEHNHFPRRLCFIIDCYRVDCGVEEGKVSGFSLLSLFLPPIVFSIGICGFLWVARKSQYKVITGGDDLSIHRLLYCIGNQPIRKAKCHPTISYLLLSWFLNAKETPLLLLTSLTSPLTLSLILCKHHRQHKNKAKNGKQCL